VADAANLKAKMAELRATASPERQAQIDEYTAVLTQTQQAMKDEAVRESVWAALLEG
jgi:hypothetical protein